MPVILELTPDLYTSGTTFCAAKLFLGSVRLTR